MQRIKLENRDEIYYLFTEEEVDDIQCAASLANGLLIDLAYYHCSDIEKIDHKLFALLYNNTDSKILYEKN